MEYSIRKCDFTIKRDKEDELKEDAFKSAGFTPIDVDEFLEIDYMEQLYTKGNVTVRFLVMERPLSYTFQYHVFENYGDEIARKKEKMNKIHLQKQKEASNLVLNNISQKTTKKEPIQEKTAVDTKPVKTKEIVSQPIEEKHKEVNESKPTNNIIHENHEDVLEGQGSLFDM